MSDLVLVETTPAPGPDGPRTWPLGCMLYVVGSLVINFGQILIRLSHLAEAEGKVRLVESSSSLLLSSLELSDTTIYEP